MNRETWYIYSHYIPKKFPVYSNDMPCPWYFVIFPILVPYKHMFYANGPHFSFFFFRSQECDTDSDGLISREDHHGGEMILTFWWKTSWDYLIDVGWPQNSISLAPWKKWSTPEENSGKFLILENGQWVVVYVCFTNIITRAIYQWQMML